MNRGRRGADGGLADWFPRPADAPGRTRRERPLTPPGAAVPRRTPSVTAPGRRGSSRGSAQWRARLDRNAARVGRSVRRGRGGFAALLRRLGWRWADAVPGGRAALILAIVIGLVVSAESLLAHAALSAPGATGRGGLPVAGFRDPLAGLDVGRWRAREFPPAVERWRVLVEPIAAEERVDPDLVLCVMQQESSGEPGRVSHMGAQGLMQVMPDTFREVLPGGDPARATDNIRAGARYLRRSLDAHGDLFWALAAYNAGIDATQHLRRESGYVPARWLGGEPFVYMHEVHACVTAHAR